MGLSLSQGMYHQQRCSLTLEQRQALQCMLSLRQTLKDPEFPDSVKGLYGLQEAHTILKDNNSRGILIGGLSEAIWNRNVTTSELSAHKDVDVAVLDDYFQPEDFEGG